MNILEEILAYKKLEVGNNRSERPMNFLERQPSFFRECYSLREALENKGRKPVIAEFKRRSPSKGWINENADAEKITNGYAMHGAAALSVLTDEKYFGSTASDFPIARKQLLPILRKDFIVDEYQIVETKSIGADIILLIAAALSKAQILQFSKTAKNLGLQVLLELHEEREIDFICDSVDVIGINNRDLKTFKVDIDQSIRLAEKLEGICKIAESGLSDLNTIKHLQMFGFNGFLIGEAFMKKEDPVLAFKNFFNAEN